MNPLAEKILGGDRQALAKAITLVESKKEEHQIEAQALIEEVYPHTGQSLRIGISGVPGVGKSTSIEALGPALIKKKKTVAVLAFDPSSPLSGGGLMGDKIRMEKLSRKREAFIRPSPLKDGTGGVGLGTRAAILLCEAFGFDVVFVETVGVGQAEYSAAQMVDCFILLVLPNAGDDIQAMKKGILELADILIVNKAHGDLREEAQQILPFYKENLQKKEREGWTPTARTADFLHGKGLEAILQDIEDFEKAVRTNNSFGEKRKLQNEQWTADFASKILLEHFHKKEVHDPLYRRLIYEVRDGKITPLKAAREIAATYLSKR